MILTRQEREIYLGTCLGGQAGYSSKLILHVFEREKQ
jgi:hypothetical protein